MAKVLLFGALGDLAGWSERDIAAGTLGALKQKIAGEDALLAEQLDRKTTLVIMNDALFPASLRRDEQPVGQDDEWAFGPPVSGG